MKRAGGRIYFYYGLLEKLRRENNPLYSVVLKALEILSEHDISELRLQIII